MPVDPGYLRTIDHWRVRFQAVGVPGSSIDAVVAGLEEWSDWPRLWKQLGDDEVLYARREHDAGHRLTASESWVRAGLYYHFGQFVLFDDDELRDELVELKLAAFEASYPDMRPPAEKVTIPSSVGELHAVVRRPEGSAPAPAVIILPGADSSKEEYAAFEDVILARGLGTISVDGPGQGETRHRGVAWRFDYESAFPSVMDFIDSSDSFADGPVGLVGYSFGGYLAPRVAARCDGIAATVSLGGCFDLSGWDDLLLLLKDDLTYLFGVTSRSEAKELALEHVSLRDVLADVSGDLLVVHSTDDRIFPHEDAYRMKDVKPDAEVVIYEGGDHCCHNRSHHAKPLIADWLVDRLGGRGRPTG